MQQDKLLAAAMRRLELIERGEAFDPNVIGSQSTAAQQDIIDDFGTIRTQWIVAANRSGKSQTCARLISWAILDKHPTWRTPQQWLDEGLLVLIAGPTGKIIEESLWPKIRSYLEAGSYKEVRTGNILQKVEIGKHRIVFQSMENPKAARERIQSYDAHIAWTDEQLDHVNLLTEIRLRVTTKQGCFLASFTPIDPSPEIERLVDSAVMPHARRYNLLTLDNPVFHTDQAKQELLSTFVGMSAEQVATRLTGAWAKSDSKVYHFDYSTMVEAPVGYSPLWRHAELVDPALKSALGLTVWAENPQTNIWYCIHAEKIRGIYVPTELIEAVRERTKPFNIIRRRSDPHEVWYIQQAAKMGLHYEGVYKKSDRKQELIKNLQQCLGSRVRIAPHCTELIEEFHTCRWSDQTDGKIVNGSTYHLLDTAQYFCDAIPKPETNKITASSHDEWLYKANEHRKLNEIKKQKKYEMIQVRRRGRWN